MATENENKLSVIQLHQMCTYGYPMEPSCSVFDPITGLLIVATSNGHIKIMGDSLVEYDFNINKRLNDVGENMGENLHENKQRSLQLSEYNANPLFSSNSNGDKQTSKSNSITSRFMNIFKKSNSKDEPDTLKTSIKRSISIETPCTENNTSNLNNNNNNLNLNDSTNNENNTRSSLTTIGVVQMIVNSLDSQLLVVDTSWRLSCWDLGCIVGGKLKLLTEIVFKYAEKLTAVCILNGTNRGNYKKFVCCGTVKGNVYMVAVDGLTLEKYCIYWNKSCKGATSKSPGEIVFLHPNVNNNPNYLLICFKQGVFSLWNISEKVQHKLVNLKKCIVSCSIVEENNLLFVGLNDGGMCVVCLSTMSVISEHHPNNYLLQYHQNSKVMCGDVVENLENFLMIDEILPKTIALECLGSGTKLELANDEKLINVQKLTLQPITIVKSHPLSNRLNLVVFFGGNVNKPDIIKNDDMCYNLFMNVVDVTYAKSGSATCVIHLPVPIAHKDVLDIHIHRIQNQIYTIVLHKNGIDTFVSNRDELIKRLTNSPQHNTKPQNLISSRDQCVMLSSNNLAVNNVTFKSIQSPYSFLNNNSHIKHMAIYTSTFIVLNMMAAFPESFDKTEKSNWPMDGGCVGDDYYSKKSISIVILSHSDGLLSLWKCGKSGMAVIFEIDVNADLGKYASTNNSRKLTINNINNNSENNNNESNNENDQQLFLSTSIGVYHHLNHPKEPFYEDFYDFKPKLYHQYGLLSVTINNSTVCVYSLDSHSEIYKAFNKVKTMTYHITKQNSISMINSIESKHPYTISDSNSNSNLNLNNSIELNPIKLVAVLQFDRQKNCKVKSLNFTFLEKFDVFLLTIDNVVAIVDLPYFEVGYTTTIRDIFASFKQNIFNSNSPEQKDEDICVKLDGKKISKKKLDNYIMNNINSVDLNPVINSIQLVSFDKKDNAPNKWTYTFLMTLSEGSIVEIGIDDTLIPTFYFLHFSMIDAADKKRSLQPTYHILREDNKFVSKDDQLIESQSEIKSIKIKFIIVVYELSIVIYKYGHDKTINQNFLFETLTYSLIPNSDRILSSNCTILEDRAIITLTHGHDNQSLLLSLMQFSLMDFTESSPPKSFHLEKPFIDSYEKCEPLLVAPCDRAEIFVVLNHSVEDKIVQSQRGTYSIIRIHPYFLKSESNEASLNKDLFYPSLLPSDIDKKLSTLNETKDNDNWNKFLNFFQASSSNNNQKYMDYESIFAKSSDITVLSSVATTSKAKPLERDNNKKIEGDDPLRRAFLEREKKLKEAEMASKNMADDAKNFNENISKLLDKPTKKRWF